MDESALQIQACMYQYSRAIYRSIKDLIDPYVDGETRLEYRREVLEACELTMERLPGGDGVFLLARPRPLPAHPPLLPDHVPGAGGLGSAGGRGRGGRVHREPDRG